MALDVWLAMSDVQIAAWFGFTLTRSKLLCMYLNIN